MTATYNVVEDAPDKETAIKQARAKAMNDMKHYWRYTALPYRETMPKE